MKKYWIIIVLSLLFLSVTIFNLSLMNYSAPLSHENFLPAISALAALVGLCLVWLLFVSAKIQHHLKDNAA